MNNAKYIWIDRKKIIKKIQYILYIKCRNSIRVKLLKLNDDSDALIQTTFISCMI